MLDLMVTFYEAIKQIADTDPDESLCAHIESAYHRLGMRVLKTGVDLDAWKMTVEASRK